ncbi:MAG TPA: YihY/virulence factor BrkB family protein [Actinomycetota bacterium]|nr:YihY/virulence factor BrkB family protein [Actinomycetota bacterium]
MSSHSAPPPGEASTDEPVPPQTGEGAEPDSPLDLDRPEWRQSLKRTVNEIQTDRIPHVAAGMAFYWFLSLFPALIALVGFLGLFGAGPAAAGQIIKGVRSILPGDAANVLVDALSDSATQSGRASVVAAVVGILLALWSASSGMAALQNGLNIAYDVPHDRRFVKRRLVAFLLLAIVALLAGTASALLVFGAPLGDVIRRSFAAGAVFVPVWTVLRWVLTLLLMSVLFAVVYYLGPNRESPSWRWISPGGFLGTLIWILASVGFSLYVTKFGNNARTYGALAGVVILLLWLYLTGLAVLVGGEFNSELERQAAKRSQPE